MTETCIESRLSCFEGRRTATLSKWLCIDDSIINIDTSVVVMVIIIIIITIIIIIIKAERHSNIIV